MQKLRARILQYQKHFPNIYSSSHKLLKISYPERLRGLCLDHIPSLVLIKMTIHHKDLTDLVEWMDGFTESFSGDSK